MIAFWCLGLLAVVLVRASPIQPQPLCSSRASFSPRVTTPIGVAHGAATINGATRFAVKYASAQRWRNAVIARTWELPNNSSDPMMLPLACPQTNLDSSQYSEDCLSMLLFVPTVTTVASKLPVFLWVHGGSFIHGSATAPSLDGANLAKATHSIVVLVQYRLGALGFNSPDGRTNFAVQDVVVSLQFLHKILPSFGGNASKITIAGQSSGANLIRALLAAPSADTLFRSAILHSDPMDFGFLSTGVQSKLQDYFNMQLNCSVGDTTCLFSLPLSSILSASDALYNNGMSIDPSATQEVPMRPVHDGTFITSTLDSTTPFPRVSKPIILSTVLNEAGPAIYSHFANPMSASLYSAIVQATFEDPRASNLLDSPSYQVPVFADGRVADARVQLERMGSDQVWRCPTWTFARSWTQNGGRAFVAHYTVGATYPDNHDISFCAQAGVVCHEDDIQIVFGTVPIPNPAQSSLIREVQARYKSFLFTGDPNPFGASLPQWSPSTTGNFSAKNLGSPGSAAIGTCNTRFWGTISVPYDYQVFGI
ncbi:alpha beta-hydrolase [Multifurca ochricompacta]|uniref:Carboxylic ester hydrolase n=1 Tax=Multifurca ochricompacta TaxID=376703 RepID=A0AAD4QPT8_9AGAM|nr:alpha beta-hydrolase [Multifurca ochricompacta]